MTARVSPQRRKHRRDRYGRRMKETRQRVERTVTRRTTIPAQAPRALILTVRGDDMACCDRARCRCACGCQRHSHYRRCIPCAYDVHAGPPPAWAPPLAVRSNIAFGDWPPAPAPRHLPGVAA